MPQIWKFDVAPTAGPQVVKAPGLSDAVLFAMQGNHPHVWMRVEPGQPEVERRIQVVGTGHEIPGDWRHVGSLQDGPFVWHLFQEASHA